jgi:hypothetical protein
MIEIQRLTQRLAQKANKIQEKMNHVNAYLDYVERALVASEIFYSFSYSFDTPEPLHISFKRVENSWGLLINGNSIAKTSRVNRAKAAILLPRFIELFEKEVDSFLKDLSKISKSLSEDG